MILMADAIGLDMVNVQNAIGFLFAPASLACVVVALANGFRQNIPSRAAVICHVCAINNPKRMAWAAGIQGTALARTEAQRSLDFVVAFVPGERDATLSTNEQLVPLRLGHARPGTVMPFCMPVIEALAAFQARFLEAAGVLRLAWWGGANARGALFGLARECVPSTNRRTELLHGSQVALDGKWFAAKRADKGHGPGSSDGMTC
jgi:hypothetical protein